MGDVSDECRALLLSDDIEKIAASYSKNTESVSAIRYMQKPEEGSNEAKMVTFGTLKEKCDINCVLFEFDSTN